jgi:hypothetical protein
MTLTGELLTVAGTSTKPEGWASRVFLNIVLAGSYLTRESVMGK